MKIAARWHCLLLVLLLGGASVAAVAEGARWTSSAQLVDGFVEVALHSVYSTRKSPVRKWTAPVSYFIVHRVGDEQLHSQLIHTHFQHLAEITGLTINSVASPVAANFLVVLTKEGWLEADLQHYYGADSTLQHELLFRHSVCMVAFAAGRKGPIMRAVAIIPVDRARARGDLASCLVEELTHAVGLPNDSLKMFPSIFSRKSSHVYLTGLDHLMLRMLYDPRVKPGMDEKAVRPILQTIAAEYARDNRFATAEQHAAEGGLAGFER